MIRADFYQLCTVLGILHELTFSLWIDAFNSHNNLFGAFCCYFCFPNEAIGVQNGYLLKVTQLVSGGTNSGLYLGTLVIESVFLTIMHFCHK